MKCSNVEGGYTKSKETTSIFDAAMARENGTPLVIIGGEQYGAGSSRDWAAKGTALLGIKAVIESFERIHRSNLVGMGVIPFSSQMVTTEIHLLLLEMKNFNSRT